MYYLISRVYTTLIFTGIKHIWLFCTFLKYFNSIWKYIQQFKKTVLVHLLSITCFILSGSLVPAVTVRGVGHTQTGHIYYIYHINNSLSFASRDNLQLPNSLELYFWSVGERVPGENLHMHGRNMQTLLKRFFPEFSWFGFVHLCCVEKIAHGQKVSNISQRNDYRLHSHLLKFTVRNN